MPRGRKPIVCPHGVFWASKCKKCKLQYTHDWLARNPNWVDPCKGTVRFKRQQLAHSRRKAGLPTEIGWKKPKGKCTICGKKHVTLVPDHNHKTKKLRDWICGPCNRALGFFEKKNAVKFLRYLARHKENK